MYIYLDSAGGFQIWMLTVYVRISNAICNFIMAYLLRVLFSAGVGCYSMCVFEVFFGGEGALKKTICKWQ